MFTRVGDLLTRSERIVRTAGPGSIPRFELVLRALAQANHSLAQAWNGALCNVPEPTPTAPAPEAPKPAPQPQPQPYDPTVHPLAQRMLADALPESAWNTR